MAGGEDFQMGTDYNLIKCKLVNFGGERGRGVITLQFIPKNTIIGFYPGFRDTKTEYPRQPVEYDESEESEARTEHEKDMDEHFSWLGISNYAVKTIIITKQDKQTVYRYGYEDPMKFRASWVNDEMKIFQELYEYLWKIHEDTVDLKYSPELEESRDQLIDNLMIGYKEMVSRGLSVLLDNGGEKVLEVTLKDEEVTAGTPGSTLRFKEKWTVVEQLTPDTDVRRAFQKLFVEKIMDQVAVLQRLCLKQKLSPEFPYFAPFMNSANSKKDQNVIFRIPADWVTFLRTGAIQFPEGQNPLVTPYLLDPWKREHVQTIFHRVACITTRDIEKNEELLPFYIREHDAPR